MAHAALVVGLADQQVPDLMDFQEAAAEVVQDWLDVAPEGTAAREEKLLLLFIIQFRASPQSALQLVLLLDILAVAADLEEAGQLEPGVTHFHIALQPMERTAEQAATAT